MAINMPSPTERVRLTPAQKQALADYADRTNQSKSDVIRQALAQLIPEYPEDAPVQGKRTDLERTFKCLWCKHTFRSINPMECPQCGEEEFQIINEEK